MAPRTGRPTVNKKTERLEIRLAPDELALVQECANKLGVTKTDAINQGIRLLKNQLDGKK